MPHLDIPLHTVIELQFDATGVRERRFNLEDRMSKVVKPVRLLGDDGWESIASFDWTAGDEEQQKAVTRDDSSPEARAVGATDDITSVEELTKFRKARSASVF